MIYPSTRQTTQSLHDRSLSKTPNAMEGSVLDRYALAYHVHTVLENDLDKVKHTDYIVDAHTGRILDRWSSLQKADALTPAKGKGLSHYNGNVVLDTTQLEPTKFQLRDLTRPSKPHRLTGELGNVVYDMAHGMDTNQVVTGAMYEDEDNTWGDGANYLNDGKTQSATMARRLPWMPPIQKTWIILRPCMAGMALMARALRSLPGSTTIAAWSMPSGALIAIAWPLAMAMRPAGVHTPVDLVAHEFGHGVCQNSANLIRHDESGGLNEANSDIIATMVFTW